MKRYILTLLVGLIALSSSAQFTGTDSLRNFNNRFITNNASAAFTNLRLHNLLGGIIDYLDTALAGGSGSVFLGIDTIYVTSDSIVHYKKNGVFRQFVVRGNPGAGSLAQIPFSNGFGRFNNDSNLTYDRSQGLDAGRLIVGPIPVNDGGLSKINATSDNMNAFSATSYGTGLNTMIFRRAEGTIGTPLVLTSGKDLWNFSGRGYTGTAFTQSRAAIYAQTTQDWTDSTNGTKILFATTDNDSSTMRTRMTIEANGDIFLNNYPNKARSVDTMSIKPLGIDTLTGLLKPMGNWGGAGGGSFEGINIGGGFRWLATPTGNIKTSYAGYGIIKDSTTNTNGITDKVDTATLKTVYLPLTLNSAKTVNQAGNNIYFTGGGKPVSDSILYTPAYVNPVIGLDSAVFNGNSITYGGLATTPDSSYPARTSKFIGLRMVNIAVSGTTVFQICSRSLNYINPGHNSMHFMCAGFNDIRTVAASANVYNAIGSAYEASLINHCMESYTSGSDCNLYGSWTTNFNANTAAGGKTTEAAYSSTTNDSLTVDVTGTNVYIGLIGIYTNNKIGNIYIDGVQVDAVSTSNQTYGTGYQSMGKYYTGLSAGTHHVKIVVGTGSNFLMVDYIGSGSSSTKPFVFIHIPKMDATGYSGGFSTDAITNTANDTLTARYNRALAAGLNVYLAQTNNFYIATTSSGLASDHIHPNDLGHYQIFSAIRTAINSVRATPGLLVNSNDGYFYGGGLDGYLKQFAYTTEITLQKVLNNSSYLPVSNYISGPGNLEFNGFNQIKLNKLRISNSITATFDGIFQIRSANGGFYILNRDLDTTKGFGFYCNGNILRVTDGYNNTDIIKIDTSFRTLFRNNKLGGLTTASATVHIEGNVTGAAGRAPLKISSGVLMSAPEDGAIEYNGTHYYATIGSTRRQLDQQAAITSVNSMTGPAITISGGTGITTSSASNDVTISIDNASAAVMHTIAKSYTPVDNTSTTETDLYSHTIPVVMTSNGTGIAYDVSGGFNDATSTPRIKLYFAGNTIFDSGVLAISVLGKWNAHVEITRVTSSTAVSTVTFSASDVSANYEDINDLTSLDFTTTNILKITGTATGATGGSGDITAKQGRVTFVPAP